MFHRRLKRSSLDVFGSPDSEDEYSETCPPNAKRYLSESVHENMRRLAIHEVSPQTLVDASPLAVPIPASPQENAEIVDVESSRPSNALILHPTLAVDLSDDKNSEDLLYRNTLNQLIRSKNTGPLYFINSYDISGSPSFLFTLPSQAGLILDSTLLSNQPRPEADNSVENSTTHPNTSTELILVDSDMKTEPANTESVPTFMSESSSAPVFLPSYLTPIENASKGSASGSPPYSSWM
eukprot:TRINITY_DN2385_c0_g1_i2.p1 TRINITY_DN2385_c0_g1~~TRINITY_DN2385_c0_g1_i2.p1  ORF type:complete len:238 (+),score=0.04 TRINITY_DN2385_c0_g1_i2:94-807(+)